MYCIGEQVVGTVTGIQPYGAFVMLDGHTQGLIHISECKLGIVRDIYDELHCGQEVHVVILDIEQYTGKISLSLRQSQMPFCQKPVDGIKKPLLTKKHYWTNYHFKIGFSTIAGQQSAWIDEALARLEKSSDVK